MEEARAKLVAPGLLWHLETDGTLTLANAFTYDTWGRPSISGPNRIADLGFRRLYVGRTRPGGTMPSAPGSPTRVPGSRARRPARPIRAGRRSIELSA